MFTRRGFLKFLAGGFLSSAAVGSYAFAIEPLFRLRISTYRPKLKNWPEGKELKIACLADLHACNPWMSVGRIAKIVAKTNAMKPDLILLLGDYSAGMNTVTSYVHSKDRAPELGKLDAPLGAYSVLGNHDWWEDKTAQKNRKGPTFGQLVLEKAGIPVLENQATKLNVDGFEFWLAGLGDQLAFLPSSKVKRWEGVDDLEGTLAQIPDSAPTILMAHEPDVFARMPDKVELTLSGHTHGGQVRVFGYSPVVPSRYGNRYAYGHIVEDDRHLIVSGGLGCSILPVRFGSPPEIVVVELGGEVEAS